MPAKKSLSVIMGNDNSSHLTKDEIAKREEEEIKAPNDNIIAPSYLTEELKNKFYEISNALDSIGLMSNLDSDALGRYLVSEFNYQKVSLKMFELPNINAVYKNYADLQDKFFKQARAAAGDLGLTISSRCKLILPSGCSEGEEGESEEEKLFGDRL